MADEFKEHRYLTDDRDSRHLTELVVAWFFKLVRRGVPIKEAIKTAKTELDWELRAKHREEMMKHDQFIDYVSLTMPTPETTAWHIQNEFAKRGVLINLDELTQAIRSEPMGSEAQRIKMNAFLEPYEEAAKKLEQPPTGDAS